MGSRGADIQAQTMTRVPIVAAACALLVVVVATSRYGIGVSTDSVSYEGAALSLLERGTLDVPLTWWNEGHSRTPLAHFPPAMSLVLAAAGGALDLGPRATALLLNAVLIVATTLLVVAPVAGSSAAALSVCALLAGPSFVAVHFWLWSEPLFLLLTACAVRLGAAALGERTVSPRIALLALCCGLATLTRYAGLSLFAGFAIVLMYGRETVGAKARRLACYVAVYGATLAPWAWWLSSRAGAPRSLSYHPGDLWREVLRPLTRTLSSWFVPPAIPLPAAVALLVVSAGVMALLCSRRARVDERFHVRPVAYVAATVLVVHLAFLFTARIFADPGLPMDERILAAALLLTAVGLGELVRALFPHDVPALLALAIACLALVNVTATAPQAVAASRRGLGFTGADWSRSATIAWLADRPRDLTLFSNAPDAICTRLPVTAKYTPEHYDEDRLDLLRARVEESAPAAVVLFDDPHGGWLVRRRVLEQVFAAHARRDFADGVVFLIGDRAASVGEKIR